ncbi:MAG: hypothetical protein WBN08_20960 [Thiogranum sp.]
MPNALQPFHLLVIALGGWLNRQQQAVIDYVMEENRVPYSANIRTNRMGHEVNWVRVHSTSTE